MATNAHDQAPNTHVNPESLKLGHEPDTVNFRAILYVPVVLVICFFFTFLTVTKIMEYVRAPSNEPLTLAGKQWAGAPLNERLARIDSDPEAMPKPTYVKPRLEGLNRFTKDDPVQYKSYIPSEKGNSPRYHPEDMRPSSVHGKELGLQDYKWVDESKGIARLPIEEAIKLALKAKDPRDASKNLITSKPESLESIKTGKHAPAPSVPTESPKDTHPQSPKGGQP